MSRTDRTGLTEKRSFCRVCTGVCGTVVSVDQNDRIPHPLKRMPNGRFEPISLEPAFSEIAAKLKIVLDRDGPEAIAAYRGSGGFFASACLSMLPDWMQAIASPKLFSTLTVTETFSNSAVG